jgi:hypothetical protein
MTAAAGIGCPDDEIGVIHSDRGERVRRMAGAAVVVTGNVAWILAPRGHAVVTAEAAATRRRVIHMDNGREVIERMAQLAVVLCRDVCRRPWCRADSRAHRVTPHAIARCTFEHAFLMAEFAGQIPMGSLELVARGQMVELGALNGRCLGHMKQHQPKRDDQLRCACQYPVRISPEHSYSPLVCPRASEGGRVVTLLALRSEAPGVHVIAGMARSADHRRFDDVLWPDVAIGATDLCVCAQQREAGVGRMIEVPHVPAIRRVAFAAILAETAVVDVVLRVTTDAFLGRIVESLGRMALPACHDHMQSREWILRLIMIEVDVLPLGSGVALLALLAQRAAMRLIGAMTVDALRAQLLVFGNTRVAQVTIEVRVCAFEGKLEARQVIETGDAPHVVPVAIGTRRSQPACVLVV